MKRVLSASLIVIGSLWAVRSWAQYIILQPVQQVQVVPVYPVAPGYYVYYPQAYASPATQNATLTVTPNSVHLHQNAQSVNCDREGCLYQRAYNNRDIVLGPNGLEDTTKRGESKDFVKHQPMQVQVIQLQYAQPIQVQYGYTVIQGGRRR